jgi:hypothetical protein
VSSGFAWVSSKAFLGCFQSWNSNTLSLLRREPTHGDCSSSIVIPFEYECLGNVYRSQVKAKARA